MKGIVCFGLLTAALPLLAADREIDYQRDVKPILHSRCYACHGALKQAAGLRLDSGRAIREGGESGPAIVVGKPAASLIVQRVSSADADHRMPPQGKPLTVEQVQAINQWITQGAQSPSAERHERDPRSHWAFRSPQRPEVPDFIDAETKGWIRNPIDAFIVAGHRRHGLTPQSPANRATLLRRVYYDLIGLPPRPEVVLAFERNPTSDAYLKLVDELLASPSYGERWARHWLDVARYGESNGFEYNEPRRNAWPYRDWGIKAFNNDMPYDEFVRMQLVGDVLKSDQEGAAAVGFLVAGMHNTVLPANTVLKQQARADELGEMMGVVGQSFLGLTIQCARCHDHKVDPISTEEY